MTNAYNEHLLTLKNVPRECHGLFASVLHSSRSHQHVILLNGGDKQML